jgi:EAL domain-containing protein (putative c-di-GMP-specific phosphodiesterase class I)
MRLRRAVERDELVLHYQPIFSLPDREVVALEALLRWQDPQRGLVPPLDFIPVAEHTGMIEPIGRWVVGAVARQLREWRDGGLDVTVAFNVSARQFRDPELPRTIAEALRREDVDPAALIVEITESTAMRDPACVRPVFDELRALGVAIAIDDFGTGHSSLGRLHELAVDLLKVDRSLLPSDRDDRRGATLAGATLGLVEGLGIRAVAEGIETAEQAAFVADRGYPLAQGFHLGRPAPPAEAIAQYDPANRDRRLP